MSSAGRLADVCLVWHIQSCHCVESASRMRAFICAWGYGVRKSGCLFWQKDPLPEKVAPQPNRTKQTCGSERLIGPTSSAVKMRRWPFYSSQLLTAKRADGEPPLGRLQRGVQLKSKAGVSSGFAVTLAVNKRAKRSLPANQQHDTASWLL